MPTRSKQPEAYVHCRTFGHSWDEVPDDGAPLSRRAVFVVACKRILLRCTVCTCKRAEVWSTATGQLLYRAYEHPEGWGMSREDARRDLMRREYLRRHPSIPAPSKMARRRIGRVA